MTFEEWVYSPRGIEVRTMFKTAGDKVYIPALKAAFEANNKETDQQELFDVRKSLFQSNQRLGIERKLNKELKLKIELLELEIHSYVEDRTLPVVIENIPTQK